MVGFGRDDMVVLVIEVLSACVAIFVVVVLKLLWLVVDGRLAVAGCATVVGDGGAGDALGLGVYTREKLAKVHVRNKFAACSFGKGKQNA